MKELAKALMNAQKNMGKLVKDTTNPHFGKKYASLHNVISTAHPSLSEQGLVVLETTSVTESGGSIQHLTLFHTESGESLESSIPLKVKDASNPQQIGSAQTYARRYLWTAIAGLAPEDDDGNGAGIDAKPPVRSEKAQPPAPKAKTPTNPLSAIRDDLKAVADHCGVGVLDFLSAELDRDVTKDNVGEVTPDEVQHIREVVAGTMAEIKGAK